MIAPLLLLLFAPAPVPETASAPGARFEQIAKEAESARAANETERAVGLFRQGLRLRPEWKEGWWSLGTLFYDGDQYAQGRDAFRRLVALDPKSGPAFALLGLCEFETRDYGVSLEHLQQAAALGLSASPRIDEVARYHEALLLTRVGRFEAAIDVYIHLGKEGYSNPALAEGMGLAVLRKPLLPSEAPPGQRELSIEAGRAAFDAAARRPELAMKEFETLIANYPATPDVHYLFGAYLMFSDPDRGVAEYKKELEISPDHQRALLALTLEYLKRQDYVNALAYAERGVKAHPEFFGTHNVLGRVLVEGGGDVPRGIVELETAGKMAPGSPQNHIALATAYAKAGRKEDAARERELFLKLKKEQEANGAP